MNDIKIKVTKRDDIESVRLAAGFTSGHESKITLHRAYASEHSIARTQRFFIELYQIPLFVSTHLIRHHVGSQPFQLTCRVDRKGGNVSFQDKIDEVARLMECGEIEQAREMLNWLKYNADRYTKVNLLLDVNAQALIDMAKLRLCTKASPETREVFRRIKEEVAKVDPDLAPFLVAKCVYRGGICCEPKPCGYNRTEMFAKELERYKLLFVK